MTPKIFKNERFTTTHENKIFDDIASILKTYTFDFNNICYLGEFGCHNIKIDGLIITPNSIIILEYKNYGGNISWNEYNEWFAGNDKIEASNFKNPYKQISKYKDALSDYLEGQTSKILNRNNTINWRHIHCMIIFHQPITCSPPVPPYLENRFSICDLKGFAKRVNQITSREIHISSDEMTRIANELGFQKPDIASSYSINEKGIVHDEKEMVLAVKLAKKSGATLLREIKRITGSNMYTSTIRDFLWIHDFKKEANQIKGMDSVISEHIFFFLSNNVDELRKFHKRKYPNS